MTESLCHTPQAATRNLTSRDPGAGRSRSINRGSNLLRGPRHASTFSVVIPRASASRRADRFRVCSKTLRASAVGRYSSREASRRNEPSPGNRPCHHRAGSKERAQHTRHGPAGSAAVMATTLCRHRGTLRASHRLASLLFGRHRAVSDYSVNGYSDSFGWGTWHFEVDENVRCNSQSGPSTGPAAPNHRCRRRSLRAVYRTLRAMPTRHRAKPARRKMT